MQKSWGSQGSIPSQWACVPEEKYMQLPILSNSTGLVLRHHLLNCQGEDYQKMQNIVGVSLSELIQEYCQGMSDVTSSKFECAVQMDPSLSNSMPMDPATDFPLCMRCLSSLSCLISVHSDRLPSCCLWRQHRSLAVQPFPLTPDAICLSHSVDSSALSYTVRSPSCIQSISVDSSHRHDRTQIKKLQHVCKFVYLHFRSFNSNFRYMVTHK